MKFPRNYVLDAAGQPHPEPDLMTWARWFEANTDARIVCRGAGVDRVPRHGSPVGRRSTPAVRDDDLRRQVGPAPVAVGEQGSRFGRARPDRSGSPKRRRAGGKHPVSTYTPIQL